MSAAPNRCWSEWCPQSGRLSVIIPVLNEAGTIASVVEFANRSPLVDAAGARAMISTLRPGRPASAELKPVRSARIHMNSLLLFYIKSVCAVC